MLMQYIFQKLFVTNTECFRKHKCIGCKMIRLDKTVLDNLVKKIILPKTFFVYLVHLIRVAETVCKEKVCALYFGNSLP